VTKPRVKLTPITMVPAMERKNPALESSKMLVDIMRYPMMERHMATLILVIWATLRRNLELKMLTVTLQDDRILFSVSKRKRCLFIQREEGHEGFFIKLFC
jgi:hypothetical protein